MCDMSFDAEKIKSYVATTTTSVTPVKFKYTINNCLDNWQRTLWLAAQEELRDKVLRVIEANRNTIPQSYAHDPVTKDELLSLLDIIQHALKGEQ